MGYGPKINGKYHPITPWKNSWADQQSRGKPDEILRSNSMSQKPYASDWKIVREDGLQYSKELDLWYFRGRKYDRRSASHNGIIGAGHQLKQIIGVNK